MKQFLKKMTNKGLVLTELLVVVFIIGALATSIISGQKEARFKAQNASIVATAKSLSEAIPTEFDNVYDQVCESFAEDQLWNAEKTSIEKKGGTWSCQDATSSYRISIQLNEEVILARAGFISRASAHHFGPYYCINSDNERNFNHWPPENLEYPSCNDEDYVDTGGGTGTGGSTGDDGSTTDDGGGGETTDDGGGGGGEKVDVCHKGKTINVSINALPAHLQHGDTEGPC